MIREIFGCSILKSTHPATGVPFHDLGHLQKHGSTACARASRARSRGSNPRVLSKCRASPRSPAVIWVQRMAKLDDLEVTRLYGDFSL